MNSLVRILFLALLCCFSCKTEKGKGALADGTYSGRSCAQYTNEPFIGTATIEVKDHNIVKVDFAINDTLNNEVFGPDYEKHYPDNELYREQSRNDWQGVLHYPDELLKKQNIDSVDAVSGATWSYNIFRASVKNALTK